jgi:hypothetical protein
MTRKTVLVGLLLVLLFAVARDVDPKPPQAAEANGACAVPKAWGAFKGGGLTLNFEDSAGTIRVVDGLKCKQGRLYVVAEARRQ